MCNLDLVGFGGQSLAAGHLLISLRTLRELTQHVCKALAGEAWGLRGKGERVAALKVGTHSGCSDPPSLSASSQVT